MIDSLKRFLKFVKNKQHIICYGAGQYGREILAYCREMNIDVDAFVVSKREKIDCLLGVPVYQFGEQPEYDNCGWILSLDSKYHTEIIEKLYNEKVINVFPVDKQLLQDIRMQATERNCELHNMEKRERCFILGMGPSTRKQNLDLLKNEQVFSCSWCSLLAKYDFIAPTYYVSPSFYGDCLEEDSYIEESLRYLDKNIVSRICFFDYFDKAAIDYFGLFKDKMIFYVMQGKPWKVRKNIYALTKDTPKIQTATVMMLKIAMYMGFRKIYLLGTEHDLIKRQYKHSYPRNCMKHPLPSRLEKIVQKASQDVEQWPMRHLLHAALNMYEEYHYLHVIAQANGIKIYNATLGGSLDEFERVKFESLFTK
jgi:hypothetical protein